MIQKDFHMHTSFSVDSKAKPEVMVQKAIDLGLTEIAFTDHQDFLPDGSDYEFHINFDDYMLKMNGLRAQYKNKIKIVIGVEIGMMPHLKQRIEQFVSGYSFEFIIGSSHDTSCLPHYTGQFFENIDKKTAYDIYFKEILENVTELNCFDVLGHLDYISRYGTYEDNTVYYKNHSDIIDSVLRILISKGKGLEINTSGIRYGLGVLHPQIDILRRYREFGGEIVTIGSDAHRPEHISLDFNTAEEYLKSAGFKAYAVFRERKPFFIDLD